MPAFVLTGHADAIAAVAVSADGHWLATGSYDGTARLWDLSAANPAETGRVLTSRAAGITDVVFSPDGRRLVATSFWGGGAVEIDPFAADPPDSPRSSWVLPARPSPTPRSRRMAAGWWRTIMRRRRSASGRWTSPSLVALACRTAGRNLTAEEWRQFVGAGVPYQRTCPNVPPGTGVPPSTAGAAAGGEPAAADRGCARLGRFTGAPSVTGRDRAGLSHERAASRQVATRWRWRTKR